MRTIKTMALLAAGICAGILTTAVHAAPDNGLGMALMSAVVDYQGNLMRGSGATAASRTSQGQYTVTFDRDVSTCTFSATPTSQGEMIGASPGNTADVVRVYSMVPFYSNGTGGSQISDTGFNLLVFCAH